MPGKYHFLIVFTVILWIAGCTNVLPDPGVQQEATSTDVQQDDPAPDATSTGVLPEAPLPACFTSVRNLELQSEGYADLPQAILAYLNAAGSPITLTGRLNARGAAAHPVAVAVADYTGDGKDDVAVALANPAEPENAGHLLVYACTGEQYELVLNLPADEVFFRGFRIWFWQDLDGDNAAELVVSQGLCGAHTCFEDLKVLGWDGDGFANQLEGSTAELPYPEMRVTDGDGDRLYAIEVTSSGFGSVGAGPQRQVTYIWRLDAESGEWRQTKERPAPSNFRIHVLHDADDASLKADYYYAVDLYRRVIEDESLDDWSLEEGNPALAAYARYRIVVTYIALRDEGAAAEALADMGALYPVGSPLHDFVEMAILFRNAYASGGLGAACTGAGGFAESHAQVVLEPLGSSLYGYANRDYTGESMCPAPEVEND